MFEIIPAILVKDEAEFQQQLRAVEPHAKWVQVDVVDGDFAPNITWGDPRTIRSITTSVKFEIDLMVSNPATAVSDWCLPATHIGRIFFHQEVAHGQELEMIRRIKEAGIEAGVSLSPETPMDSVFPLLREVDALLLLGVTPGFQGQQLQQSVIETARAVHASYPGLPIEVDGGVKPDNIKQLADAGVRRFAVGSFINQHQGGPAAAMQELRRALGEVI
jgi:ribulose-phosphate 3-epimerase